MSDLLGLSMIIFLVGVGIGTITNDKGVRDDCERLGKFRTSGKVYECHLQSAEGEKQ